MPVDEAPRLPDTPLPEEELSGELGGHSLQLVTELNAFAAAHRQLVQDVEDLEDALDQNEAVDASEGQLSEVDTRLTAAIAQAEDDARAAAISGIDALTNRLDADLKEVSDNAAGYADVAATLLREEISRSADDVTAAALAAVDALSGETDAGFVAASQEATAVASTVAGNLGTAIEQAKDDLSGLIAGEVGALNERINKLHPIVQTSDGVQADIAAITIPLYRSVLLEIRILAQRTDRLERALYTIEALCRAVPSFGTLTVSGIPADGDQIEIGGVTYTFKDVLGAALDVQRDAGTAEANIDNLVAAITLTGTPGTEYHADTPIHPSVSARKDTAATMQAVAKVPGVAGDAITTSDPVDGGGVLAWGGATLASGSDMTVSKTIERDDVEDDPAWDKDLVAGTGSSVDVKGTGAAGTLVDWLVVSRMTEI